MQWRPFVERFRRGFFLDGALASLFGALTFWRLSAFSDPPGLNGYFYLKQTKVLATLGDFYFSDHSLAFLPIVVFRWLAGNDLVAFQLAISFTMALALAGIYFFVERSPADFAEKFATKLLITWALFSSFYFSEFSLGFFKNFFAATLLVWCAGFLVRDRPRWASLFFLLAFFTHKSSALIGAIFGAVWFGEIFFRAAWSKGSREQVGKNALIVLGLGLVLAGLFLWHFPKAEAFLSYVTRNFSAPGPRLRWWWMIAEFRPRRAFELLAWGLILAFHLWMRRTLPNSVRRIGDVAATLFLLAVHPFQGVGAATLGYRLLLLLPIFIYPLASLGLYSRRIYFRYLALAPLTLALIFAFQPFGFSAFSVARQMKFYSGHRSGVEQIKEFVKPEDHLISHHGMEFFVDYVTDIRSRSFLPDSSFTGNKFRLVFMPRNLLPGGIARDELNQSALLDIDGTYFLLTNEDWLDLRKKYRFPYSWKNRIGKRPAHVYE